MTPSLHDDAAGRVPAPLVVAASLAGIEAALLVIQGGAELLSLRSEAALMAATTALFFVVYGLGLAVCAFAMHRRHSWARAPVVVAQLIQVMVAVSFWGGGTTWVAIGLGVVALVVLAGIFHPASIATLADEPAD